MKWPSIYWQKPCSTFQEQWRVYHGVKQQHRPGAHVSHHPGIQYKATNITESLEASSS